MRLDSDAWKVYQQAHSILQGEAKAQLEQFFDSLPWDEDEGMCLRLLCEKAAELAEVYGTADATLSAGFYDDVMQEQGANVPPAELAEVNRSHVMDDVRKAYEKANTRETAKSMSASAVSGHVKRAGIETMRSNAVRDHAMWAWVCIGDSCPFCRALGSNSWQQASRSVLAGDHAEHIHDNCDCQFVVKKPGETLDIEGYDPEALAKEYENADGKSAKDRINAMRRADYTPEKAAERNERRRELYAQQKAAELEERIRDRIARAEIIHDSLYTETPEQVTKLVEAIRKEESRQWEMGYRKTDRGKKSYRKTYGAYVESFSNDGRIKVEDFTRLEAKELQLAQWLADAGHTIEFRNPDEHNKNDGKTTDVFLDGKLWEFKRSESKSVKKMAGLVTERLEKQGPRFVLDLSVSKTDRDKAIEKVARMLEDPRISDILVVRDGKAVLYKK